jgi:hypothetical protein
MTKQLMLTMYGRRVRFSGTKKQHDRIIKQQREGHRIRAAARKAAHAATSEAKIKAAYTFLSYLSSEAVIGEMVRLIAQEPPEVFWPIFVAQWPRCDAAFDWSDLLVMMFRRVGPCPLKHVKDANFWSSLPAKVTVYRGASRSRIDDAISWTTSKRVAGQFARGHRFITVPDPVIATATITKANIWLATNERNESEVLCLPRIVNVRPATGLH